MNGRAAGAVAGVVLLLVQAALTWVALDGDEATGRMPTAPVTPATPPAEALGIESALALTDPVARGWDGDAVLVSASMEVVWPQEEPVPVPTEVASGGAMILVYGAGDAQLTMILDRGSGVIFHVEEGAWSEEVVRPLPTATISRSSQIAVLAAEVSYGTAYRAACPEYRFVTRVYLTADAATGNPAWLVSYLDERHRDRPDLRVRVDAVTGETVGGEATDLGCVREEP